MPSASDPAHGERERYERIAATATKLLAMVQGWPPDTPLDLVLEMLEALITDARELRESAAWVSEETRRELFVLEAERAAAEGEARARLDVRILRLERIDAQVAKWRGDLADAIKNARNACSELAAVRGTPSQALLEAIGRALTSIRGCSEALDRLGYERTDAISTVTVPRAETVEPTWTVEMVADPRELDGPGDMAPAPRLEEVPAPPEATIRPVGRDDQPPGSISPV